MPAQPYVPPAFTDLGTLHETTLSWLVGADGHGFNGAYTNRRHSVNTIMGFRLGSSDDDDLDPTPTVQTRSKKSGSGGRHSLDIGSWSGGDQNGGSDSAGGHGGGRSGGSKHSGFNVSHVFKGLGGSN